MTEEEDNPNKKTRTAIDAIGAETSVMDITTRGNTSIRRDFSSKEARNEMIRKIIDEKPMVLMTSSMPDDTNAKGATTSVAERKARIEKTNTHLNFICMLHTLQHAGGRYFIHEHSRSATSWHEECIKGVLDETKAKMITADFCMFDTGENSKAKAATFMTNMPAMGVTVNRRCNPKCRHGAVNIICRARGVREYPEGLCKAIVRAVEIQKQWDAEGMYFIGNVGLGEEKFKVKIPAEEEEKYMAEAMKEIAWDDISGEYLDPEKVKVARKAEMEYYRKMGVYRRVPLRECIEKTGKPPIGVRWVDINKGDRKSPLYRSRLVAKQFKKFKDDDLYAATPPIESFRIVISSATTGNVENAIMVNDVSRAYMYADCEEDIYVELCDEDCDENDEEPMCGKLEKAMYGTRPAAKMWQKEGTKTLEDAGFEAGKSSPCIFYHKRRDIMVFLHGDDFVSSGAVADLKWLEGVLKARYSIKTTVIGEDNKLEKEVRILNKIVRWHPGRGVTVEADPRHVEILIKETGVENARTLSSTGNKPDEKDTEHGFEGEFLDAGRTTKYRANVARLNYLSADRGDITYSVKELARKMSQPNVSDEERVKRLVRYLKGKPRVVMWYKYQDNPAHVEAYSDSDWAGCKKTRRSTSGGCVMYGSHYLKGWSKTQATVALSSAEAELYAAVKASAEALGILSVYKDFGKTMQASILGDASAALGIIKRKGIGKMRHVNTNFLWVQEKSASKELVYSKVSGKENPADLFTKFLSCDDIDRHMAKMGNEYLSGKDDIALTIN